MSHSQLIKSFYGMVQMEVQMAGDGMKHTTWPMRSINNYCINKSVNLNVKGVLSIVDARGL